MTGTITEQKVAALADALARPTSPELLFEEVSTRMRQLVPFDGACWFATDPATVLATAPARIENVGQEHCDSFWEREARVEDVLLYRDLARAPDPAATLYDATDQRPARSARYREFLAPQGYGDELRAVLRVGRTTWGILGLYRDRDRPAFSSEEVAAVARVAPAIADAVRSVATTARAQDLTAEGPGTALYDRDGVLQSLDERAERLFTEVGGPHWAAVPVSMAPILAVVARARAVYDGRESHPASLRLRATSGRWIAVHASCLRGVDGGPGPTALTIEPCRSSQLAPIIIEAYQLTEREQEVTRAVARGLSNAEIAAALHLSPHTVRDHLKAVFAKVGVGSRGELVAKLFAEHYGPALHAPDAAVTHVEV
jgi:DNA-binding CsgD family transcriptional regulator